MTDLHDDVAELFDRAAPGGPDPDGWAARARRRSRGRRAAVGITAVAVVGLLALPLAGPVADLVSPRVDAMPADPVPTEDGWEPPQACVEGAAEDRLAADLGDVTGGAFCWEPEGQQMTMAMSLEPEQVEVVVAALESSRGIESDPIVACSATTCADPNTGRVVLTTADGGEVVATRQVDGRLLWSEADGQDWMYPAEPVSADDDRTLRAALDGIFESARSINLEGPDPCLATEQLTWSRQPMQDAAAGYLCDPTGATGADVQRVIPAEGVAVVATAAAAELTPRDTFPLPSGWSVYLADSDGDWFHLALLSDATFSFQDVDGTEWSWVPSGAALSVLESMGMEHLPG